MLFKFDSSIFSVFTGERNHKLHFIKYFNALQNGLNHNISTNNLKKFQLISRLGYSLLNFSYLLTSLIQIVLLWVLSIYAYITQQYYYSLIPLLIWNILISISIPLHMSSGYFTPIILYLSQLYLKMRFNQIAININEMKIITKRNMKFLIGMISDHNEISMMTNQFNQCLRYLMFLVYISSTIVVNTNIFIALYGNSDLFMRIFLFIIAIIIIVCQYLNFNTSANLSKEAHRCYNHINSMLSKYHSISLIQKLKVL